MLIAKKDQVFKQFSAVGGSLDGRSVVVAVNVEQPPVVEVKGPPHLVMPGVEFIPGYRPVDERFSLVVGEKIEIGDYSRRTSETSKVSERYEHYRFSSELGCFVHMQSN